MYPLSSVFSLGPFFNMIGLTIGQSHFHSACTVRLYFGQDGACLDLGFNTLNCFFVSINLLLQMTDIIIIVLIYEKETRLRAVPLFIVWRYSFFYFRPVDPLVLEIIFPVFFAYAAKHAARIAHGDHVRGNIFRHHASRADDRVVPDGDAAAHRDVRGEPDIVFNRNRAGVLVVECAALAVRAV